MYVSTEHTKRQVSKMRFFMFITAVCFMFLIKLRWPKTKSLYETFTLLVSFCLQTFLILE